MRGRDVVFWLVVAGLLLPALLLSLTRAVEPGGAALWLQVEAFTPLAIVLYAAALLVVLVPLLVRRRWRSAALPVALVCVAGLVVHAWWYAPQVTGANPPAAAGAAPLVVMTANLLKGEADGADVVRRASAADVDLLVVEEVTAAELAAMDRSGLADLLPYSVGTAGDGAAGTMAFSRSPVSDGAAISTTLDSWSFHTEGLTVLAVHAFPPTDAAAWRHDHAVIADAVARLQPDLALGDFNATADHAPMRALAAAGYRDAGELADRGWQPTWPARGVFDLLGLPLAQIDHVLVGPRLAALAMRTTTIAGSDHRGVLAEVARR